MYLLAYKKPPEKAIFRQRQFVRYVKGKEICIRVINGDIKMRIKRGNPITGQFPAVQSKMISDGYKYIRKGRNARKSKIRPK